MIMLNHSSSTVFRWQLVVKVLSDLFCEHLVIKKDEDKRLCVKIKWVLKEAFIVSWIFNASLHLVGCVHGVGVISHELDLYAVQCEHFLHDSFEDVRGKHG